MSNTTRVSTVLALLLVFGSSANATDVNSDTEQSSTKNVIKIKSYVTSDLSLNFERTPWQRWHMRIQDLLASRSLQPMRENFENAGPLHCTIVFSVTRTGEIKDLKIERSSFNPEFDSLAKETVLSLKGHKALRFPPGSVKSKVVHLYSMHCNFGRTPAPEGNFDQLQDSLPRAHPGSVELI